MFENLLVVEAFCRAHSGVGSALAGVDLGSEILLKFGSQEQKQSYLIPMTKGSKRWSIAFAESEDDRDVSAISTIAETTETGYVIRGGKGYVQNAPSSDAFIVLCREKNTGIGHTDR